MDVPKIKLMIVDDHAGTREVIRRFLSLPGVTFHECASGEEAVDTARKFKPHWVTMDIKLPGMDGFEATKAIQREHPGTRVLIVSSFNEPHLRAHAHSAGAVGFTLKENIIALRLMLENEIKNLESPAPQDDVAPSAQ